MPRNVPVALTLDEAKVWVAESEDVPGLVTEAKDLDDLVSKLRVMVPELSSSTAACQQIIRPMFNQPGTLPTNPRLIGPLCP